MNIFNWTANNIKVIEESADAIYEKLHDPVKEFFYIIRILKSNGEIEINAFKDLSEGIDFTLEIIEKQKRKLILDENEYQLLKDKSKDECKLYFILKTEVE